MIEYKQGSIFSSTAQCLVIPVNCVGIMGKGLALESKRTFPGMYKFYKQTCANGDLRWGTVGFWVETERQNTVLCLFPTKQHWRESSSMELIKASLIAFQKYAPTMKIEHVAFPKVGCGLGGLDFEYQVKPLLERFFHDSSLHVEVYI